MSKISKKQNLNIKDATISVENGKLMLEVEGYADPVNICDFIKDFTGQNVAITIATTEEIA